MHVQWGEEGTKNKWNPSRLFSCTMNRALEEKFHRHDSGEKQAWKDPTAWKDLWGISGIVQYTLVKYDASIVLHQYRTVLGVSSTIHRYDTGEVY